MVNVMLRIFCYIYLYTIPHTRQGRVCLRRLPLPRELTQVNNACPRSWGVRSGAALRVWRRRAETRIPSSLPGSRPLLHPDHSVHPRNPLNEGDFGAGWPAVGYSGAHRNPGAWGAGGCALTRKAASYSAGRAGLCFERLLRMS